MEEYRLLIKRIIMFIGLIAIVFAFATIGYMIIEKWPFIESLFMTAITLSTFGYSLQEQISNAGKIFSMILILSGVVSSCMAYPVLLRYSWKGTYKSTSL